MRFSHSRWTKKNMSYEVQPASDRKKGTTREIKKSCRKIPGMSNRNWYMGDFLGNPSYGHPWTIPKTISKKSPPHFQTYLFYFILNKEFLFPINFHNNYFSPFLITTSNFIIISLFFPIHQYGYEKPKLTCIFSCP
jgi:hypothetical protein